MIIVILDTETTGLIQKYANVEKQPHIIEVGAIKIDFQSSDDIVKVDEINQLIKPPVPIIEKITKITGICDDDVKDCPVFFSFLPRLRDFFEGVDVLICHNASFDVGMLKIELNRLNMCAEFKFPDQIVCTVQEYEPMFNKRPTLKALYQQIIGEPLAQTHRALDDARALQEVLARDSFSFL